MHQSNLIGALVCLSLSTSCSLPEINRPWQPTRKGSAGWIMRSGLYEDFTAETRLQFETNQGGVDETFETDLIGRLGLMTGIEYYVADDVAVLGGVDYRVFDAEEEGDSEGLIIGELETLGVFLGLRRVQPFRDPSQRARPFFELNLTYVPVTRFDFELDLGPGATQDNPQMTFRGGEFLLLGAAWGVLYQVSDRTLGHVSLIYEYPLIATRDDDVALDFDIPTVPVIPVDTELAPEGFLFIVGLTYGF